MGAKNLLSLWWSSTSRSPWDSAPFTAPGVDTPPRRGSGRLPIFCPRRMEKRFLAQRDRVRSTLQMNLYVKEGERREPAPRFGRSVAGSSPTLRRPAQDVAG